MSRKPASEKQLAENRLGDKQIAETMVLTPWQNAVTMAAYTREANALELTVELQQQVKAVNDGNRRNVEGLLIAQAHTLNAIFNTLAQRANGVQSLHQYEVDLKLALRAQNQCRATLETLSTIKTPPNVAFVKQANIAHNQQVNNGAAGLPAAIDSTPQLEQIDGNYLDTRTAPAGSRDHSSVATVGKIYRPKDTQRQG